LRVASSELESTKGKVGGGSMSKAAMGTVAGELLAWLEIRREEMVERVRVLVEHESPSTDKRAVDGLAEKVGTELERIGGAVKLHAQKEFGACVQADFEGAIKSKPVLLLGHIDTVYELGMLKKMPWRNEGGNIFGPGVFDMKCGVVQMMYAISALKELRGGLPRPVIVLLNSDEEVGSTASRKLTEKLAKQCEAVLVFEPAAGPKGMCKTARKGVGNFRVMVRGRAAHAGLDFEKGASAVTELAKQIVRVSEFTDLKRGLTVNPGIVRGGTRTNVVADFAEGEIDVRVVKARDGEMLERKFGKLRAFDRQCKVEVSGGMNRAPFERTAGVVKLYKQARGLAVELGFELRETAVGGGSDGNFTAGMGIPTLDGLGAVGDGAHSQNEHVVVREIPRRAALAARLIETL
jgi:glutamate carboxypeptidase